MNIPLSVCTSTTILRQSRLSSARDFENVVYASSPVSSRCRYVHYSVNNINYLEFYDKINTEERKHTSSINQFVFWEKLTLLGNSSRWFWQIKTTLNLQANIFLILMYQSQKSSLATSRSVYCNKIVITVYGLRHLFLKTEYKQWEIFDKYKAYKNEWVSKLLLSLSILFTYIYLYRLW